MYRFRQEVCEGYKREEVREASLKTRGKITANDDVLFAERFARAA